MFQNMACRLNPNKSRHFSRRNFPEGRIGGKARLAGIHKYIYIDGTFSIAFKEGRLKQIEIKIFYVHRINNELDDWDLCWYLLLCIVGM